MQESNLTMTAFRARWFRAQLENWIDIS